MYEAIRPNLCWTCPSILVLCNRRPWDWTQGWRKEHQPTRVVIHQAPAPSPLGGIHLKKRGHAQWLFAAVATPENILARHQIGCRKHPPGPLYFSRRAH